MAHLHPPNFVQFFSRGEGGRAGRGEGGGGGGGVCLACIELPDEHTHRVPVGAMSSSCDRSALYWVCRALTGQHYIGSVMM